MANKTPISQLQKRLRAKSLGSPSSPPAKASELPSDRDRTSKINPATARETEPLPDTGKGGMVKDGAKEAIKPKASVHTSQAPVAAPVAAPVTLESQRSAQPKDGEQMASKSMDLNNKATKEVVQTSLKAILKPVVGPPNPAITHETLDAKVVEMFATVAKAHHDIFDQGVKFGVELESTRREQLKKVADMAAQSEAYFRGKQEGHVAGYELGSKHGDEFARADIQIKMSGARDEGYASGLASLITGSYSKKEDK
jgi:hypothetical protein